MTTSHSNPNAETVQPGESVTDETAILATVKRPMDLSTMIHLVTTVLAVGGLVFSIGVNWERVSGVSTKLDAHIEQTAVAAQQKASIYVRSDVEEQRLQRITERLENLSAQVAEVKVLVQRGLARDR